MSQLDAGDRIRCLLRHWYMAREAWTDKAEGTGVRLLPSDWVNSSYPELDRCLTEMRESKGRPRRLWWHVTNRYRDGHELTLRVPYRVTRRGVVFSLPDAHVTEIVAGPYLEPRQPLAKVTVYRWSIHVDPGLADKGIDYLSRAMYQGDTSRIRLPDDLYRHATGQEPLSAEQRAARRGKQIDRRGISQSPFRTGSRQLTPSGLLPSLRCR